MQVNITPIPKLAYLYSDFENDPSWRRNLLVGGRMGGKSLGVVDASILYAMRQKEECNIMYLRETQASIDDSMRKALVTTINKYGLTPYFDITAKKTITCKHNQVNFIFVGAQDHNVTNVKSKYNIKLTIGDEAEVFSRNTLEVVEKTILRENKSKVIYCVNPSYESADYHQHLMVLPEKRLTIPIDYRDNIFLTQDALEMIEQCRKNTPQQYNEQYLGHFKTANIHSPFNMNTINQHRVLKIPEKFKRICIGLDPNNGGACDFGVIVCGFVDGHYYVIRDASTLDMNEALNEVVKLYKQYDADMVFIEKNNGGQAIKGSLLDKEPTMRTLVEMARGGKKGRTTISQNLYEDGKLHHCGHLVPLEQQMIAWNPNDNKSPSDRIDALAHSINWLHKCNKRVYSGVIKVGN